MSNLDLNDFNQKGEWSLESKFQRGIAIASFVNSYGLITSDGKLIAGTQSPKIKRLTPNHFLLYKEDGVQLFLQPDRFGIIYDAIEFVTHPEVFFIGTRNFKAILVNHLMNEIGTYDALFQNGEFLLAYQDGEWGVINCYNKIIVDFKTEQ